MAKLARVLGKVFAGSAPLNEIGQFGSALAGNPTNTQDVATIQSLPAYSKGWGSGVISSRNYPPIEEVNGVLKTISYQTCYLLQEGIPEYDSSTEYSNTSIVKSISGTRLNFYISLQNNNIGHPLSDTTYWAQATLNSGRNVGEIITSTIPLNDSGVHLLDGSVLSGSGIYSDFVSYISNIYNSALNYFCTETEWQTSVNTYGVCGKFVYNSTNNTVRLPKITGFIEGSIDANTLGNLTPAGVPNIWASWNVDNYNWISGSVYTGSDNRNGADGDKGFQVQAILDASRSSAVYGRSNTVQPQSIKVLYYIVVANTQKTEIQVDIDNIATELNGKADTDFSNVDNTAKILMSGMGMPSSRYIGLTLGASGTAYTAPANGQITFRGAANASNQFASIEVYGQSRYRALETQVPYSGGMATLIIDVNKGDTFKFYYNIGGQIYDFFFIYAQGSESEA